MTKKKSYVSLLTTSFLLLLGLRPVLAVDHAYQLRQSVGTAVDKDTCIQVIRRFKELEEVENELSQKLTHQLAQQDAILEKQRQEIQSLQAQQLEIEDHIRDLHMKMDQAIEAAYQEAQAQDETFTQATEEEQTSALEAKPAVQAIASQLKQAEEEGNQLQAQLAACQAETDSSAYQHQILEDQLEQAKANHTQLNQCLLYPYSSHVIEQGQLPLNPSSDHLADYLIGLNQALERLVPLAFQKVKYQDLVRLFDPDTISQEQLSSVMEGKQEIVLSEEGKERYHYAQELNLADIERLAHQALWTYFQDQDRASLIQACQTLYGLKIAQYHYFYAINRESFLHLKESLASYLNQYQYGPEAEATLAPLVTRYQLHLVTYNAKLHQWCAIDEEEEPFLQLPELSNQKASYNADSTEEDGAGELTYPGPDYPKRVPPTQESGEAGQIAPPSSNSSATTSNRPETADRTEADGQVLNRLKSRLNRRQKAKRSTSSKSRGAHPPKPSKNQGGEASQQESKSSLASQEATGNLPNTGETHAWMTIALGLLALSSGVLVYFLYRRYQAKQALKKIHFD